jgi:hypothetical protein
MQCPFCGCVSFHVKDPFDQYETHDFEVSQGKIEFSGEEHFDGPPKIDEKTETYCNQCAWHGKLDDLKR